MCLNPKEPYEYPLASLNSNDFLSQHSNTATITNESFTLIDSSPERQSKMEYSGDKGIVILDSHIQDQRLYNKVVNNFFISHGNSVPYAVKSVMSIGTNTTLKQTINIATQVEIDNKSYATQTDFNTKEKYILGELEILKNSLSKLLEEREEHNKGIKQHSDLLKEVQISNEHYNQLKAQLNNQELKSDTLEIKYKFLAQELESIKSECDKRNGKANKRIVFHNKASQAKIKPLETKMQLNIANFVKRRLSVCKMHSRSSAGKYIQSNETSKYRKDTKSQLQRILKSKSSSQNVSSSISIRRNH